MNELPPFRPRDWLALLVVALLAVALRAGYLALAADQGDARPAWQVQGEGPVRGGKSELAEVSAHLREEGWFASRAPLSSGVETTAQIAPAYPWLLALLGEGRVMRWMQCGLGTLTVVCFFLFARRAFRSLAIGVLAGLLTALHPYWIVNTAEISDGVVASFLVGACLFLGTRASQVGGAFTSLLFGAALACLALVRAAFLPFALLALLWFLLRVREGLVPNSLRMSAGAAPPPLRQAWLCALLAFLGFANGLAPWFVRNLKEFGEPLPIVSSAWLHLYMGNNSKATGGYLEEPELRASLPPARLAAVMRKKNQAERYDALARDTLDEIVHYPGDACNHRLAAGAVFLLGEPWLRDRSLARRLNPALERDVAAGPDWLAEAVPGALAASLVLMGVLGLCGWRRAFARREGTGLLTIAVIFLPLPYLLGHAGILVGPRLPIDGVWLTYAALGLGSLLGFVPRDADGAKQS